MIKKILLASLLFLTIAKADLFQKGEDTYLRILTAKDNSVSFYRCYQSVQSCTQVGNKTSYTRDELNTTRRVLKAWGVTHTLFIAENFLLYLIFDHVWNSALDATASKNYYIANKAGDLVTNMAGIRRKLNPVYDFKGAKALSDENLNPTSRLLVKNIEEYIYYLEAALKTIK